MRSAALFVLAACGGASVSVHDDVTASGALAACQTGDVAGNLAIVHDLRDSYHEMIVCGGLALSFDDAVVNVLANAALGHGGPSQLAYRGNGTYATANGMMAMHVALADGAGVAFDVLDPQSYLAGVSVDATGMVGVALTSRSPWQALGRAGGAIDLRFSAQGPAFALLGLGDGEVAGGRLHVDPVRIARAIGDHIAVSTHIDVQNTQGGTTIHYILDSAPQRLTDVLASKDLPMTLTSIEAEHPATGQRIRVTEWTMQFKGDGGKVLDGTIGLDVDGGAFPYAASFSYPHRMEPDIDLRCRQ